MVSQGLAILNTLQASVGSGNERLAPDDDTKPLQANSASPLN
jgi:hypothetical protein